MKKISWLRAGRKGKEIHLLVPLFLLLPHRVADFHSSTLLPRCWQDWERIANSWIFERDKGKLGENAALVDKARAEREIYTHRLLTNSPMLSSPDSSPPEEANPSPRLFDYRHTSCKHRNFLDFRTSLLLFLFAFIILSPLSSIFPAWRLIGRSYLFFQRAPTLAKNFTKLARPILRTTREAWGPASPYPRSILLE